MSIRSHGVQLFVIKFDILLDLVLQCTGALTICCKYFVLSNWI